jgi:hypothetical protein
VTLPAEGAGPLLAVTLRGPEQLTEQHRLKVTHADVELAPQRGEMPVAVAIQVDRAAILDAQLGKG